MLRIWLDSYGFKQLYRPTSTHQDIIACGAAIAGLAWPSGLGLLKDLPQLTIQVDMVTFNGAIHQCALGSAELPKTNTRWWFQIFWFFSPRKLGKMNPFWLIFFQMGWNLKPPTSNSSPLKMGRFPKRKRVFQSSIFRGYSMLTFGGVPEGVDRHRKLRVGYPKMMGLGKRCNSWGSNMTIAGKWHHEWRCISYWTWGLSNVYVIFQGFSCLTFTQVEKLLCRELT